MRDVYSAGRAVERGANEPVLPMEEPAHGAAAPVETPTAETPTAARAAIPEATGDAPAPPSPAPPAPVSRRAALRVLGALPLAAGALGAPALGAQPPVAGHPRQPHATPNQPAGPTPQPPANAPRLAFLTAREARTASILADDILPRDERSGSATEAGVIPFIDFHLSVPEASADSRTAIRGGLRWLDVECRRRFGVAYDRATTAQRHAILDDISGDPAKARPAMRPGAAFFARFRDLVAGGFFSSAMGHRDLQYSGNVFVPKWEGCPQPALDRLGVSYALMDTRVAPQRGEAP